MYEVIVGNIGTVYDGSDKGEAMQLFNDYVAISNRQVGRTGGEPVTLLYDDEIIEEYLGR